MEIIGYIGAILIGLSLGLIGGGGSILTLPILVYLFKLDPVLSTAYSLFIVGLTSLVGSISHMRMGNIDFRTAVVFGSPSILSVFLTRLYLVPAIPDHLFTLWGFEITKPLGLLLLFAIIMLMASYSMIRKTKSDLSRSKKGYKYHLIFLEGIIVGILTGLVGAGGGFMIIPALVLFAGLEMKKAVGTSLIIIATKALIGFTGDLQGSMEIDWSFLLIFSAIAVLGIILGSLLSKSISNEKLKPAFGWFVLTMGIYIIIRETILH
ncbi:MAG: sulfite exporter TauE/SafE family protein [Bacteroidota bacterium]